MSRTFGYILFSQNFQIANAFDTVSHNKCENTKLAVIRANCLNLFQSYLQGRTQIVKIWVSS